MNRDIRFFSLIVFFAGMFFMGMFVVNAGDDFFYASFTQSGLIHFFKSHIDHYIHTNGRCIVHFLDSIFLWMPHIIWKIVNPIMWTAIIINIYKIINLYIKNISKLRFIVFMLCGAFLMVHIELAKESLLWMTGSFNYTYPLMMFTWYWYLLFTREQHSLLKLCAVGFLAAASMEQESALTFILTAGVLIYDVKIRHKPADAKLKKAVIVTAIGAASLFLAPGNILRMDDEIGRSAGTAENILNGIDFMLDYCISSNYMIVVNIALMTCCALYLNKNSNRLFLRLLIPQIAALLITNHSGEFEWMGTVGYGIVFYFSRIYYFMAVFMAVFMYMQKEKCAIPMLCAVFAVFSCGFIVFSPTLGPRVLLFAEVMIIMITVMIMVRLVKKQTMLYAVLHLVVFVAAISNVVYITHGFYVNSKVYKENEVLIEEWKKTASGELHQKQYRNDAFEHSMPYNSEYHDMRYKQYYDIPTRINIIWD